MGIVKLKKGKFYRTYDEVFYVTKNTRHKYAGETSTIIGFRMCGNRYNVFYNEIDKEAFVCEEITREQYLEVQAKALSEINKILQNI